MISFYHRIAKWFFPWRYLLLACAVAGLATSAYQLNQGADLANPLMGGAFMLGVWLLLLASISYFFAQVPERPDPDSGFLHRCSSRIKRFGCYLFACLFSLLTLTIAYMSIRSAAMTVLG